MKSLQLELLVDRYFEIDPAGSVRFAAVVKEFGPDYTGVLYERLARADINEALSQLSQIEDAAEARVAAAAVFRGLGGDERAFELVSASLPGPARADFRADSLLRIMQTSPRAAFEEAIAVSDPERRRALTLSIVPHWAREAPRDAMAAVDGVADPELNALLRSAVLQSWSDTESLADYLDTLDLSAFQTAFGAGAFGRLVEASPQRAAEIASRLPPSDQRRAVLWSVASGYARQDPEAALAWAGNVSPPEPSLAGSVLQTVASKDPVRAFDLAGTLEEPARSQGYLAAMNGVAIAGPQFTALANRVLAFESGQTKTAMLTSLAGSWATRPGNAQPALEWMVATGDALPQEAFARVGMMVARTDPELAARYVDRVPKSARNAWVAAVSSAYTNTDPQRGITFLERFRGDAAYDAAAVAVVQQLAISDPARAAGLLSSVRDRGAAGYSADLAVAQQWSLRDPSAAAAWAIELPPQPRMLALSIAAGAWAQRDPAAVQRWALALPRGEQRDAALAAAMRASGAGEPDPALLNGFSDERARESALLTSIMMTASADAEAARRLVDRHIADPRRREQAHQAIDNVAQSGIVTRNPALGVGTIPGMTVVSPTGVPPTMILGPNGQPIMLRSPAGVVSPLAPIGAAPVMPAPPANVPRDPASDR